MTGLTAVAAHATAGRPLASAGLLAALGQPFFQHALLAGTAIAAASGLTGCFLVLRAQVFTGDALGHAAFTGALAALAYGIDPRIGLYAATIAVAVLLGALGRHGRAGDVAIGGVFSWLLGLGVLFLSLYSTSRSAGDGSAGVGVLFGSVLGLSRGQALAAALFGAGVCAAVLVLARPLLLAAVDETIAAARGVPVRLVALAFLVAVGVCAAQAAQAVGSLLVLGLLTAPAGAAHRMTDRPLRALALSAALAVAETWAGLAAGSVLPGTPPSFAVLTAATLVYAATWLPRPRARRTARARPRTGEPVRRADPA